MQGQIDSIIKPFMNFVNMFKHTDLQAKKEIFEALISSVVLVVTKAEKTLEVIKSTLEEIVEGLLEEEQTNEKEFIIMLLKNVV